MLPLAGCSLDKNTEPPMYGNMDIVPVTGEDDLTPNKPSGEIIGDESETIIKEDTSLPQSENTDNDIDDNSVSPPTGETSKPSNGSLTME